MNDIDGRTTRPSSTDVARPLPAHRVAPATAPPRAGRPWLVGLMLLVLAGGFAWLVIYAVNHAGDGGRKGDRDDRGPIPVAAEKATRGDFSLYVDALGSVSALNTVTVRSRVDGEVLSVQYAEGQLVEKGQLLVEIDPRQYQANLQQAQGQLARDQAMLRNAQADVERYTAARETVSQQQIDTANATLAEITGTIKIDQAAVTSAELQLSYCRVVAPLSGKIGLRTVDAGNVVRASDTTGLATITQLDPIAVVFNLPEVNLPAVLDAAKAGRKLVAEIYDAARTRQLASGALEAVDNQIDSTTATVRIKAVFPNHNGLLFPNQFVNVRLKLRTIENSVLVPTAAVQASPNGAYVYAISADSKAEMRIVKTGPSEGGRTVIESGVADGEAVVTQNLDKIAPGHAIKPTIATTQPASRPAATNVGGPA